MNKLIFITEARFFRRTGDIYSFGGFSYQVWERYLKVFDQLVVIARISEQTDATVKGMLSSGDRVSFIGLPYYVGVGEYLKNRQKIKAILSASINQDACYIARIPGTLGSMLIDVLRKNAVSYGCEVVGDPDEVFKRGAINHPLRPLLRSRSKQKLKTNIKNACAVLYVTKQTLQRKYPSSQGVFTTNASNVDLKDEDYAEKAKTIFNLNPIRLISIGSLAQLYKAPDVVLKAISILRQRGVPCQLTWLGDGKYRKNMEEMARSLNVFNMVTFAGNVPKQEVLKHLQESDLFLLVSRTEGLPRAMIEAMSQGLPCIGSNVGGIPELISPSMIVKKNDHVALADLIASLISHPEVMVAEAQKNLDESKTYRFSVLSEKRELFYKELIQNKQ